MPSQVSLFEVEPDLLRRTPPALRSRIGNRLTVPVLPLVAGRWEPKAFARDGGAHSFILLNGLLTRETRVYGRCAVELLGAGHPLRPCEDTSWSTAHYRSSWNVAAPSQVACLNAGFEAALAKVPGVVTELMEREERRLRMLGVQVSIASIPRLDVRLLGMLWHLADIGGRRRNGIVVLELPLRHQLLANLVGAGRTSVATRMSGLRDRGLVGKQPNGQYTLHGPPPTDLEQLEALLT